MPFSPSPLTRDHSLAARLHVVAALARCPLAALYRVDGERARLVASYGAPADCVALAPEAPAWRMKRRELTVVAVVGRGPAVPESAVLPASFGVAALISVPIEGGALLLLADSTPRPDLAAIDEVALSTACAFIADALSGVASQPLRSVQGSHVQGAHVAAARDPISDLPERGAVEQALQAAIAESSPRGAGVAVAVVALDRFERIADWLGPHVGDELLKQVAERLGDTSGEKDRVGRGSGHELVVILTGIHSPRNAFARVDRLRQAMREPFHVQGYELALTATIGLSLHPEHADEAGLLLRYAGIALHRAEVRRGSVEAFTPELKEAVEQRAEVERRLRRAIGAGELLLHYQPKIDLRTRRTKGVEALIRWKRGDQMISPGQFLPVAEETELIVPIGTWVLQEACRQMKEWLEAGLELESVAVNVSALQFARIDFVGTVERTLRRAGLDPRHLELEVTETSLMDDVHAAAERLSALRRLGVRVSVDDFGTGYSSLAYLQRLPVDLLKIDRSFVKDLDADGAERDHARVLAQAITGLGHHLGMRVLAEGVETEAQLDALIALECDEVQGFFFARPLPAEQLPAHLAGG